MTMPGYTASDNLVPLPPPAPVIREPEPGLSEDAEDMSETEAEPETGEESDEGEEEEDDMSDLFEVTPEDINGGGDENGDDMSDLFEVTPEDINGTPSATRRRSRKFKRDSRQYQPPPSSLGGIQY